MSKGLPELTVLMALMVLRVFRDRKVSRVFRGHREFAAGKVLRGIRGR